MVIKTYTQNEINELLGMLRHHKALFNTYIEKSSFFERYNRFLNRHRKVALTSEDFLIEVIKNTLFANKFIAAFEQKQAVNFFDKSINYFEIQSIECSRQQLLQRLTEFSATTITAATFHGFIDKRWLKELKSILVMLLLEND